MLIVHYVLSFNLQFLPKNTHSYVLFTCSKIVVFLMIYVIHCNVAFGQSVSIAPKCKKNDDKTKKLHFYNYHRRQELYMIEILIGAQNRRWCWALHC